MIIYLAVRGSRAGGDKLYNQHLFETLLVTVDLEKAIIVARDYAKKYGMNDMSPLLPREGKIRAIWSGEEGQTWVERHLVKDLIINPDDIDDP